MINWLKQNKLIAALTAIVLVLLLKQFFPLRVSQKTTSLRVPSQVEVEVGVVPPIPEEYPPVEEESRLIIEESSVSLVVEDVRATADKVIDQAKRAGGFMVSRSLTRPEEAPFATVIVRVPSDKLRETVDYFRDLAVKVSSENLLGRDVTAEYTDLQARLTTLEKTKIKLESILNQATQVQDILQVERELIRLQDQIDNLKGRQKYLEQTAKLAKITVYLSTDELALPYAPAEPFRPKVIFKLAIRSLVLALRKGLTGLIWIGVFGLLWLPVVLIIFFVRKRKK